MTEKKVGRFPEPGERVPLSFRVTPAFKAKIDRTADSSGRSIAQEVELRLERSFDDAMFPPQLAALLELVGRIMLDAGNGISSANRLARQGDDRPWMLSPYPWNQAIEAGMRVLEKAKFPAEEAVPVGVFAAPDFPEDRAKDTGEQLADGTIEILIGRDTDPGATANLWAPRVREGLGPIAERFKNQPKPADFSYSRSEPGRVVVDADGNIRGAEDEPEQE
jgi:hypothetical protein